MAIVYENIWENAETDISDGLVMWMDSVIPAQSNRITYFLKNKTEKPWSFGKHYNLYILHKGRWELFHSSRLEGVVVESVECILFPDSTAGVDQIPTALFKDRFTPGTYRLEKCFEQKPDVRGVLSAVFEVR